MARSALIAMLATSLSCDVGRASVAADQPSELVPDRLEPVPAGAGDHRIVLDKPRVAMLRAARAQDAQEWRVVRARCDADLAEAIPSGYQAFDWADAVADLSLCWIATGRATYADGAIRYVNALLDDRFAIGDGQGGETAVTHDSGYGIRTFAVYSALAYDWLRGAPGMDARLRSRIIQRLQQWLGWYAQHGYLRTEQPFANYYWGYFTALSLAGLAVGDDDPAASAWRARARELLAHQIVPAFRDRLDDGGWPEGWQYGEYTTVEIALVVEAFRTGAGLDLAKQLPWLVRVVDHHVHALLPDERTVYDGGAWSEHPARPSALALAALGLVLDRTDPTRAAEARWLVHHVLPPITSEHAWIVLLAMRPGSAERDPRAGAATSLLLPRQGLSFMRSDWSRGAVWASFQAGPFLTEDHQNKDQGHFELWRGGDALLVDGGDYEGSATINHNTLLVDDAGAHLNYTPNQGVWGKHVATTRFGDDGQVVVVVGDLADAYAPACVTDGCRGRSVEQLTRTLVYVRPSVLIIEDRVRLEKASYGTTWAAHVTVAPQLSGDRASAAIGSSRVDLRILEPAGVELVALREPAGSGEGPHRTNKPWGPMWRIEAASPRGASQRRFLAYLRAADRNAVSPRVRRVVGAGFDGVVADSTEEPIAVLFATPAGSGFIDLGAAVSELVVVGLAPGTRYHVEVVCGPGAHQTVSLSRDDAGSPARSGGFLRSRPPRCEPPRH